MLNGLCDKGRSAKVYQIKKIKEGYILLHQYQPVSATADDINESSLQRNYKSKLA